jgi:pimeloyl-ACP methyl ester carboxylesterase
VITPPAPPARNILTPDGQWIATYDFGEPEAPVIVAVHGFASSGLLNWHHTGWARDLTRAGFRVIAIDQRGHGASTKPHSPDDYRMTLLVADLLAVLDAYLLDTVTLVGYSLGGRVGWHAALELPDRVSRAVLGGVPDGYPLRSFQVDQARAWITDGTAITDRMTSSYVQMASGIRGNDLTALVALVEGMRDDEQPDPRTPPRQPVLFATGTEDPILEKSRALATATPLGEFFEVPGRNHFNAPTSREFRDAAVAFLQRSAISE